MLEPRLGSLADELASLEELGSDADNSASHDCSLFANQDSDEHDSRIVDNAATPKSCIDAVDRDRLGNVVKTEETGKFSSNLNTDGVWKSQQGQQTSSNVVVGSYVVPSNEDPSQILPIIEAPAQSESMHDIAIDSEASMLERVYKFEDDLRNMPAQTGVENLVARYAGLET